MGKTVRYYKSTKDKLEILFGEKMSLNKALGVIMKAMPHETCIGYGCADSDKFETTSVDDAVWEWLNTIKERMIGRYNDFLSISDVIEMVVKTYSERGFERIVSINVKGYKTKISELRSRLKKMVALLNGILPEIIFLQEFIVGEEGCVLSSVLKNLKAEYNVILPVGFDPDQNYDFCICIALIRKDVYSDVKVERIENYVNESGEYRFRYNLFSIQGKTYMNIWIPQTYNASEGRKALASQMWTQIMDNVKRYWNSSVEFYLVGDFNSYIKSGTGIFEDQMKEVEMLLVNTKAPAVYLKNTCYANVLDQVYVNRYTAQHYMVVTSFVLPSFMATGLSDHEALLTLISGKGRFFK